MGEDDLNQLQSDIQDSLEDIGYEGISDLAAAVDGGVKSAEYTGLVLYMVREVGELLGLEDHVQEGDTSSEAWAMELSSFLRELGCPHSCLTQGAVGDRLADNRAKLVLLDYLLSELMAARMISNDKPKNSLNIQVAETPTAAALKKMLLALGFPKPPDNITSLQLWDKVTAKVKELQMSAPAELVGKPLLTTELSADQWEQLQEITAALSADYSLRRKMLLTRLDATIQSFTWSDRMKGREGEIGELYRVRREVLSESPGIGLADLVMAREDTAVLEKVSSSNTRQNTRTSLNKVLIGAVPDRGGRTDTMQAPPPEMPSWSQRQPDQGRGGGRGGGSREGTPRGGRGGRGGYQGGGGGGYQGGGGGGGYQGGGGGGGQGGGGGGGYQGGGGGGGYQGGGGGGHHGGGGYQGDGRGRGGHGSNRGSGRVQGAGWSGGGGYNRGRGNNRGGNY